MSAVTSLSLAPPQFLICVDNQSESLPAIRESGVFAIHYLGSDQEQLAKDFAKKGGDKFASAPCRAGQTGAPILDGVIAFVECALHATYPGGDHTIIVGDVVHGQAPGGEPLGYHRGGFLRLR
jgi:flavin reductase (DIM6/NTAB) family NADH-FMN oxidoreductase RutF